METEIKKEMTFQGQLESHRQTVSVSSRGMETRSEEPEAVLKIAREPRSTESNLHRKAINPFSTSIPSLAGYMSKHPLKTTGLGSEAFCVHVLVGSDAVSPSSPISDDTRRRCVGQLERWSVNQMALAKSAISRSRLSCLVVCSRKRFWLTRYIYSVVHKMSIKLLRVVSFMQGLQPRDPWVTNLLTHYGITVQNTHPKTHTHKYI